MKLSVTQNKVEIVEKGIVNQGEYNVIDDVKERLAKGEFKGEQG